MPTSPATTALTIGDDADAAVAARSSIRRRITGEEVETLAKGGSIGNDLCYVGRGGRGAAPSKWGNPFRVNTQCAREEAINKHKSYVSETGLPRSSTILPGCHCRPEEPCHGDHLLELARVAGAKSMGTFLDDGLPVRSPEGLGDGVPPGVEGVPLGVDEDLPLTPAVFE